MARKMKGSHFSLAKGLSGLYGKTKGGFRSQKSPRTRSTMKGGKMSFKKFTSFGSKSANYPKAKTRVPKLLFGVLHPTGGKKKWSKHFG